MWLFTKHGFYSAVCARQGDGAHHQPVDPDRIMVRARVLAHLENLKQTLPELLGECEIHESPSTDYAFRLFVEKSTWAQAMARLSEEIDYDNFKSEVSSTLGGEGKAYKSALGDVWEVMYRLQCR